MIDSFDDNCKPFFNFRRQDLHRILPLLRFPETCELGYRHKMSGEEVLLRGLYELSSGDEQHDIAVNIFERLTILGWGFDLEVLALARHYNYNIQTFKIKDWSDPKAKLDGLSNDSPLSAAFQTLKDLIKIRINIWMRQYSKLV